MNGDQEIEKAIAMDISTAQGPGLSVTVIAFHGVFAFTIWNFLKSTISTLKALSLLVPSFNHLYIILYLDQSQIHSFI